MKLPAGTASAVHIQHGVRGAMVLIAPPHRAPTIEELAALNPAGLTAWLTHDPGLAWPNRAGARLIEEVIDRGGLAALIFTSLADALAAQRRLRALLGETNTAPAGG